ncbi:nitronate monooxygenase family protein [Roseovarius sp. MMSF_3281]|uniref:NAD(P)H-dependent flavin oxidoreductase n=1 Tax=Roseovarius sp. MMSF_3281 TaxID=3046694 RepID=UPI00273E24C2|nr:nitronate monooxygenase [Roseovarius sp. MMSF_3281]
MQTRLTEKFGLTAPIVSAPMAMAAGGRLAGAVSEAGGLGFIGGGYCDADWIAAQFSEAGNRPVGCGFITWALDQADPGLFDSVLARGPAAVFLSFGEAAPYVARAKAAGVPSFVQVQDLAGAKAARDAGAEVIVAQGTEAGGHGATRGTMSLVPEVADAVGADALVLAAGGIADGRGLAAALMLGADGVLVGTRFWAAEEALVAEGFQRAALEATGDATQRSSLPDIARGLDWPKPFTIRTLRNTWLRDWEAVPGGPATDEARAAYAKSVAEGDAEGAPAIAGEAVGLIRSVQPAAEIVAAMVQEARVALDRW